MRNLDILTKFSSVLSKLDGEVTYACIDEFGQCLYVYTSKCLLYVYKLAADKRYPDIPSITSQVACEDLSD
jgi:hypothetical protein